MAERARPPVKSHSRLLRSDFSRRESPPRHVRPQVGTHFVGSRLEIDRDKPRAKSTPDAKVTASDFRLAESALTRTATRSVCGGGCRTVNRQLRRRESIVSARRARDRLESIITARLLSGVAKHRSCPSEQPRGRCLSSIVLDPLEGPLSRRDECSRDSSPGREITP